MAATENGTATTHPFLQREVKEGNKKDSFRSEKRAREEKILLMSIRRLLETRTTPEGVFAESKHGERVKGDGGIFASAPIKYEMQEKRQRRRHCLTWSSNPLKDLLYSPEDFEEGKGEEKKSRAKSCDDEFIERDHILR